MTLCTSAGGKPRSEENRLTTASSVSSGRGCCRGWGPHRINLAVGLEAGHGRCGQVHERALARIQPHLITPGLVTLGGDSGTGVKDGVFAGQGDTGRQQAGGN